MANEITKVTDKNNVDHPLRDAAAQTALTGILNGQSIDSFGDVESALAEKFPRSEQDVLGAKQFIPYPFFHTTKTENNVTFTDNGDGTVTIDTNGGTASADTLFFLFNNNFPNLRQKLLDVGDFVLSGGYSDNVFVQFWNTDGSGAIVQSKTSETPFTFSNSAADFNCVIKVLNGTTVNNVTIKPMISLSG